LAHAGSWLKMKKPAELPIRGRPGMNPSHPGSDEQMFGAKQQNPDRGQSDIEAEPARTGIDERKT
jgi:hypothetical protein